MLAGLVRITNFVYSIQNVFHCQGKIWRTSCAYANMRKRANPWSSIHYNHWGGDKRRQVRRVERCVRRGKAVEGTTPAPHPAAARPGKIARSRGRRPGRDFVHAKCRLKIPFKRGREASQNRCVRRAAPTTAVAPGRSASPPTCRRAPRYGGYAAPARARCAWDRGSGHGWRGR